MIFVQFLLLFCFKSRQLLDFGQFWRKVEMSSDNSLKRRIEALEKEVQELRNENKRLKSEHQSSDIIQTIAEIHGHLKSRFVRMDDLVHNSGLQHIATKIFKNLDIKTLGNCRAVSKGWKSFIDNDNWWHLVLTSSRNMLEHLWPDCNNGDDEFITFLRTLRYVSDHDIFKNVKLLAQFMVDHFIQFKALAVPYYWDPDTVPNHLDTPLHFAVSQNRVDVFELLKTVPTLKKLCFRDRHPNHPTDPEDDPKDWEYGTSLDMAFQENRVEIVDFFIHLQGDKKVDFANDKYGMKLFQLAWKASNVDVVKLCLKHTDELDLNFDEDDFVTMFKTIKSKEVLMILMSDERFDISSNGNVALQNVFQADTLNNDEEGKVLEIIETMFEQFDIDLTLGIDEWLTALHFASYENYHRRIEAFFKFAKSRKIKFDVNAKDGTGMTVAHRAFTMSNNEYKIKCTPMTPPFTLNKFSPTIEVILKYAKEFAIDFEVKDRRGRTPIHYVFASKHKPKKQVEWFLEMAKNEYDIEFNLNVRDLLGRTPQELSDLYG